MEMRGKTITAMAVGSVLGLAGSALASGSETFNLGDFTLGADESAETSVTLSENAKDVIGIEVSFDYEEPTEDFSWASDLAISLTDPDGGTFVLGGLGAPNDDFPNPYAFQGSDSDAPGFYEETGYSEVWADSPKSKGEWTIELTNTYGFDSNPNNYNDVTITFNKVPAPGALALVGAAGLCGIRRRRRS